MGMWYGREKVDEDLWEKVRHELAMMPYISHYDFISFAMTGNDVILTGWTVRDTNRSGAFNRVKRIEGVGNVTNNIFVLPLGSFDNDIRARAMAAVQRQVPRYFWSSGSTVRIVVRNSQIILLGQVATEGDKTRAFMAARGVPNAFHVFNLLQVVPGT
jgi:osmotically-inducible protein OsmY